MAVASSYNSRPPKYDVFLSFSGEDTREGFTNTLYYVLNGEGIDVFIDDGLPRGEQIEASLMRTIEKSMIAVVVFSKKYASSSWCLDELLKIVECHKIVLPIFYKVDPFHVQKQKGKFGDEFVKLQRKESKPKIKKWSDALAFVATQSGWDLANYRTEIDMIKEVAICIRKKLDSATLFRIPPGLVGISSLVDDVCKLLNSESTGVQFLGIWGMGGVGKTTLAEVLYHQLSKQFDACYFAANVREESSNQLRPLRNKIYSKILGVRLGAFAGTINDPFPGVIDRLRKMKVLIVLDNVKTSNQVTDLVGNKTHSWCGRGSKVIVTSRDLSVLKSEHMTIFEVKELNPVYALRLFCLNAFKQNQPPEGYLELSQQIVNNCKGVPLALKVLGSLLYKREKDEWVSTLRKLGGSLNMEIEEVLKISYYDLDREEKIIFLDITCFFRGDDKDMVKDILEGCDFSATIGISRLIEKCLITVSEDNKLEMHDLIQKMGWEIAAQHSSQEFSMRSRFWTLNDIYNVLKINPDAIEGIFLNIDEEIERLDKKPMTFSRMQNPRPLKYKQEIGKLNIKPKIFSRMQNLRLLKFERKNVFSFDGSHKSNININGDLQILPNNLRYIHWDGYPCESLPTNFSAKNIVELNLHNSKLKRLWDKNVHSVNLKRLKVLDLRGSESLIEFPNLASASNLEKIILDECEGLLEIPSSIQKLQNLAFLSLRNCVSLDSLPSFVNLTNLKTLDLYRCKRLKQFPETSEDIEVLNLEGTAVVDWPESMSLLNNLKAVDVTSSLRNLPRTMHLNSLNTLNLCGCSELQDFPEVFGNIQRLNLESTGVKELPSSFVCLHSLVEINLQHCKELERLPNNFGQLKCLEKLKLSYCTKLFDRPFNLSGLYSIKELHMEACKLSEFPTWVNTLLSLKVLDLSCNGFDSVPESIKELSLLEVLCLSGCTKLQSLPELPCRMNDLVLRNCTSLTLASTSFIAQEVQMNPQDNNFPLISYRFNFNDCKSLAEDARRNIVTNALRRIQHTANNKNEDLRLPVKVSLPGSEIPNFFDYRGKYSSIIVNLPKNWCNTKFRGFIFAVIAGPREVVPQSLSTDPIFPSMIYNCDFVNENGSRLDSYSASFNLCEDGLGSRNLVLQYSGDIYSPGRGNQVSRENHKDASQAIFQFWAEESTVRESGVHFVYAQSEDQNDASSVETPIVGTKTEPCGVHFVYAQSEDQNDAGSVETTIVGPKTESNSIKEKITKFFGCFRHDASRYNDI